MAEFGPSSKLDRAIDFSLGLLSDADEKALLREASQDAELEECMRQQCAFAERDCADIQDQPRQLPLEKASPVRPVAFRRRQVMIWGTALAASLALFLIMKPQAETKQLWLPVDDVLNITRSDDSNLAEWRRGVELYAAGDLEASIEAFQAAEVSGPTADLSNLYLASALFNAGYYADAQATLGLIEVESLPYPWRDLALELSEMLRTEI